MKKEGYIFITDELSVLNMKKKPEAKIIERLIEKLPEKLRKKYAKNKFYRQVFAACLSIPKGQTRTYKWIAGEIGQPSAFRAVGNALAKNPFAPVVPCHRVIRCDGQIGGYSVRGGRKAKRKLLKKEKIL